MKFLKKVVIGVLVYFLCFVSLSWVCFFIKGAVPDTLIQYGMGGGAIELLATTLIEIFKSKWEKNDGRDNEGKCDPEADEPEVLDGIDSILNSDSDSI